MKISEKLQEFLRTGPVQLDIENNNFVDVYRKAEEYFKPSPEKKHVGELTVLFYEAGIDPLNYMNRIPTHFLSDTNIKSFKIPQHITDVCEKAFDCCKNLTDIAIPDNVASVGSSAFSHCYSLTSVTIGNGVTSIGTFAFNGCKSLTSVTNESGVTGIGAYVFSNCPKLDTVRYRGTKSGWRELALDSVFDRVVVVNCIDGSLQLRLQSDTWIDL